MGISAFSLQKESPSPSARTSRAEDENPFLSYSPVGLKIIDFESKAGRRKPESVILAKGAYSDLFGKAISALSEKGLDRPKGEGWTQKEALDAWAEVSSIIWSNFSHTEKNVISLIDGFAGLSGKSGSAALDCDTSAFFAADVLSCIGIECKLCSVPGHTLLKATAGGQSAWIETLSDARADGAIFHSSADKVKATYPGWYSEEAFSEGMGMLYSNRSINRFFSRRLFSRRDIDGALSDAQRAVELDPANLGYLYNLGTLKSWKGDDPGAALDLGKFHLSFGKALSGFGLHKDALLHFQQALSFAADSGAGIPGSIHFECGIEKLALGDFAGARKSFGLAIEGLGQEEDARLISAAHYQKGVACRALANSKGKTKAEMALKEAYSDFSMAIGARPDFADAYYARGSINYSLGDFDSAVRDFKESVRLDPKYGHMYYGNTFALLGKGNLFK